MKKSSGNLPGNLQHSQQLTLTFPVSSVMFRNHKEDALEIILRTTGCTLTSCSSSRYRALGRPERRTRHSTVNLEDGSPPVGTAKLPVGGGWKLEKSALTGVILQ